MDKTQPHLLIRVFTEMAGTFFLMFAGCKAIIDVSTTPSLARSVVGVLIASIAFGVALVLLVRICGDISGAHFNPAVSFAAFMSGKVSPVATALYMVAQLVGATAAVIALYLTTPQSLIDSSRLGLTTLAEGYGVWALITHEFVTTLILCLAVVFVALRDTATKMEKAVTVGGALMFGILCAGTVTGGGLNPARVLASMIVMGDFTYWWAYLAPQFVAAVVASVAYHIATD